MKILKKQYTFIAFILLVFLAFSSFKTNANNKKNTAENKEIQISDSLKWSERMALSSMKMAPKAWQVDKNDHPKWDYKLGMVLVSYEMLYKKTKNIRYRNYVKETIDTLIDANGAIKGFKISDYNIDYIEPGKVFFDLYTQTKDKKYLETLHVLREQLAKQPRTPSGGFWHKNLYPDQMWQDGLYMAAPFYARYTTAFENGKNLEDVARQFELIQAHTLDPKTGLIFHAFDESKKIAWANATTGASPTLWSRAMGWYAMALVDALDYFPKNNPKRNELVGYLNQIAAALVRFQHESGLWYQVANEGERKGNFLESSSSAMFAYTFAKGVKKGYLPAIYKKSALKAFDGLTKKLILKDADGTLHLTQVCASSGLGGTPFRDGSYDHYLKGGIYTDNSLGNAAFIMAALELDK